MEALLARLSDLPDWQICLLATYLLAQGFILTIFPEEIVITTLGLLWSQEKVGFFQAMFAIQLGLLPANSMTVFLGGHFGPKLLKVRPFVWVLKKEGIEEALTFVRRYGKWIIAVTRFVPIVRGPVYVAAGLSGMGVPRFLLVDALASCVQVPLLLYVGSVIGKNADSLMEGYQRIGVLLAVLVGSTIAINFGMGHVRKARRRKRATKV